MDEVPVANSNPVNLILDRKERRRPLKRSRIKDSFINFIYMFPFALIISIQLFFLGSSIGRFTTFPFNSITSYIYLSIVVIFLFFVSMLLRSMIYSSVAGLVFVFGIYSSWFGNFYSPLTSNLMEFISIIQAAWSARDIPFDLMMTGAMTFIIVLVVAGHFFVSIVIKGFFEIIFGKEWGDGKRNAYIFAIILLFISHVFLFAYNRSDDLHKRLNWSVFNNYQPVERFITRTPGGVICSEDYLWLALADEVRAYSLTSGGMFEKIDFSSTVVHKGMQKADFPVLFSEKGIIIGNRDLSKRQKIYYPESFEGIDTSASDDELFNLPLTSYFLKDTSLLLVLYDYGFAGLYDIDRGEKKWLRSIDRAVKTNRTFSNEYLIDYYFEELNGLLLFSAHNGFVRALSKEDGEVVWEYRHDSPVHSGRGQKAYLSLMDDRYVVAFYESGDLVTLESKTGRRVFMASNRNFSPSAPAFCRDRKAKFLTDNGIFYKIDLDGGEILFSTHLLPEISNLMPVIQKLEKNVVAHRDRILRIGANQSEEILRSYRQVFATEPVFDGRIMYIGTREGYIYCIHPGSAHVKWTVRVHGELMTDSLKLVGDSLLVLTRSGSVYSIDKDPGAQFSR